MARMIPLTLSLTETSQFRRLVEFASEVQRHATQTDDYALIKLVDELHSDLLGMGTDDDE